ncbi:aldo/keto reductase [Flavobacterium sp. NKUCC04_CG]|uniref:aldo/keto reductase n=1 Tax=Flavobacterium sp. NKUCC04_CG TaxID=2842121 RepID=UPI001C5B4856|nr:aldo/keto reductase [Flavobacterium sp. NKUCC04_CG]MBW3518310.1 aldo/keto reductase [Flavobacterium sp. NKUCC04_CG]
MKQLKFNNGDLMPAIGLGTWKSNPGEVGQAVKTAISNGYRHIDCAAVYGNEAEIGQALSDLFDEGVVKREELWITSKLWNDSHQSAYVLDALKKTLSDLQLDYLDLYLIHWPVAFKHGVQPQSAADFLSLEEVPIIETWKKMEEAVQLGLVKHIGVSNFSIKKLKDLLSKATIKPEVNQVELHPFLQQNELLQFAKENKILLTGYSPLGSGDRAAGLKKADEPSLLNNEVITEIAKNKGCTTAQVLIAWQVQRGTAVIPKSTNAARLKQNLESINCVLTAEEISKIAALDKHYRYVDAKFFDVPGNTYSNVYDE